MASEFDSDSAGSTDSEDDPADIGSEVDEGAREVLHRVRRRWSVTTLSMADNDWKDMIKFSMTELQKLPGGQPMAEEPQRIHNDVLDLCVYKQIQDARSK